MKGTLILAKHSSQGAWGHSTSLLRTTSKATLAFQTALAHLNLQNHLGYHAHCKPQMQVPMLLLKASKSCGSAKV